MTRAKYQKNRNVKNNNQKVVQNGVQKSKINDVSEQIDEQVNENKVTQNNEKTNGSNMQEVKDDQNDKHDNVLSWIGYKLKNVSNFVEAGTIISIISIISVLIIVCFKITMLNIIGVPFELAINTIDIKSVDFVMEFGMIAAIWVLMMFMDFIANSITKWLRPIFWIFVILAGIFIGHSLNLTSYFLSSVIVYIIVIRVTFLYMKHSYTKRPKKEIKNILRYSSKVLQTKVVLFEVVFYLLVLCVGTMSMASLYVGKPTIKTAVVQKEGNDEVKKVVVYNSSSEMLTAKYDIEEDKNKTTIKIDTSSLELVEKGNDPINLITINNAIIEKGK